MNKLVSGILIAGYLTIGLFFLRYWKSTHDRLFIMFATSFWILAIDRILYALTDAGNENTVYLYIIRLAAFILILLAIVDKNRT